MSITLQQRIATGIAVGTTLISIITAIASWMMNAHTDTWSDLLTVRHVGSLMLACVSVLSALATRLEAIFPWDESKNDRRQSERVETTTTATTTEEGGATVVTTVEEKVTKPKEPEEKP